MTCCHAGKCDADKHADECDLVQKALSHRHDSANTWLFYEIESGVFALFDGSRTIVCIGTIEEIVAAYRNREPTVKYANLFENIRIEL